MRLSVFTKSHIFHYTPLTWIGYLGHCYTHVNSDVSELLPEHSGHVQKAVLIGAVLNAIKVVQRQRDRTIKLVIFKH